MPATGRSLFPYFAIALLAAGLAWATSFSTLPPADFTFVNGTEVESVDPARVTGSPEGRIITALFEGLYRPDPKTLQPLEAVALRHEVSDDNKVYTFHLRKDAKWSDRDGTPVTAHDFAWSWLRLLHPETGSQYAFLLTECVVNAKKYQSGPDVGDPVEVELADRKNPLEPHPHGTLLAGKLISIVKAPKPTFGPTDSDVGKERLLDEWTDKWVYTVEIEGKGRQFCKKPELVNPKLEKCAQVLLDRQQVGIKALNDWQFQVRLISPTPYFVYLTQFYPLFPVQRACVERYGYPGWVKEEHIVTNGAYQMEFRKARNRIRLRKNPRYWDAANVKIEVADALAVESSATGLNMYLEGQVDWTPAPPPAVITKLRERDDYYGEASLTIAFYRVNVTRSKNKPLDNVLVRRALNMAIDKQALCDNLLRAGQKPARSFVPPGLDGYEPALCREYDVKKAQQLLSEAGYPGGRGIDSVEILYNSSGDHGTSAEFIGDCWRKNLGLKVSYRSLEWGTYLSTVDKLGYDISRSGWTGDYPDPNTFLNLFVSHGEQNQTGWKNPQYDKLIEAAGRETDPQRRMRIFHDAEVILMDELPIIPIYSYVIVNMVKPYVHGFYANAQDVHPLRDLWIDQTEREKYLERSKRR